MAKLIVPAGALTQLETDLTALFTDLESPPPTVADVVNGRGGVKGLKDAIGDFVADCEDNT